MSGIAKDITELTGGTPLVRINKLSRGLKAEIIVKLESFNPLSSIKDRVAVSMIEAAEKKGLIGKDTVIIEPTSGNTGVSLAFVCASRGYRLILVMPETMSIQKRKLLKIFGAELILVPGEEGMAGAVKKAEELVKKHKSYFILHQFENPANPEAHRKTTAEEIWQATEGKVDIFVAGIGTGGTFTGVAEVLKERKPGIKAIVVEPESSSLLSGNRPGAHKIEGIGAGFIPKVLNKSLIDRIVKVTDEEAKDITCRLAKEEGILAGISSGAVLSAALKIAKEKESEGKMILVILPDTGERYLSGWLFEDV